MPALDEAFQLLPESEKQYALNALNQWKHGSDRPPLLSTPVAALLAQPPEPLDFLVNGLLARGQLAMLGGRPKSGKSWLVLQLAQAVDSGRSFLGRATNHGRVLYAALEDGRRRFAERCRALDWQPDESAVVFRLANFNSTAGDPGPGLEQVREAAAEFDLIIIDTLLPTLNGRISENDNTAMGAIVNELARIAHTGRCAVLLVHHTNKGNAEDDKFLLLRGASALRGAYDLGMLLDRRPAEQEAILHLEARDFNVTNLTIRQAQGGAGWELVGEGNIIRHIRAGRKVVEALEELGEATAEELAKHLGVSRQTVHKQLGRAERDGLVTRAQGETNGPGRPPEIWFLTDRFSATEATGAS